MVGKNWFISQPETCTTCWKIYFQSNHKQNRKREPPSINLCFQGSPLFSQKDFFPSQFNWPEKTQEWEKLTTLFQISKKEQRIKKFFKKGQFPTKTIGNPRIYLKPWLSSQQWLEERSSLQVRKKREDDRGAHHKRPKQLKLQISKEKDIWTTP